MNQSNEANIDFKAGAIQTKLMNALGIFRDLLTCVSLPRSLELTSSNVTFYLCPVWPDDGMKSSPNLAKVARKLATAGFTWKVTFL